MTRLMAIPLRPMAAGCLMYLAVTGMRGALPAGLPEALSFAVLIATGAAVYPVALFVVSRGLAMEMIGMFRRAAPAA